MWVFGLKMRVGVARCVVWARWGRKKVRKSEKNCKKMQKIEKNCEILQKIAKK